MDESSLFSYEGDDPLAEPTDAAKEAKEWAVYSKLPKAWARQLKATHASGSMWALAETLIQQADVYDSFPVATAVMSAAGVTKRCKVSLLKRLEALGLIAIEWRKCQSPIVTPITKCEPRLHRQYRYNR